ncbi:hypothetical protein [Sphingomonas sp.]|uniref:hypothetical protein n=1 Tax=Sphingomonas sp. TaxID=28214 RepID=UPI000DB44C45|nr:hypothetical protein [Sphingomonas sp.]PZU06997.1 MAG: hypothetical protein DI605_16715 [Sphingomonas sp.]
MRGRQGRFLLLVIGGWALARAIMLWPAAAPPVAKAGAVMASANDGPRPPHISPSVSTAQPVAGRAGEEGGPGHFRIRHAIRRNPKYVRETYPAIIISWRGGPSPEAIPGPPDPPERNRATALPAPGRASRPGIEAQAYLFLRPGSGRALAAGSALGGSQAALRIAMPIDGDGHGTAAARLYAPLAAKGAEAALGLDWHPYAGQPLRISVERRQRIDSGGRSAWSAYAAGGFYRTLGATLRLDAYAQAGIVGARRGDLFADGAVRIERPIPTGRAAIGLGGGLWGAAQPRAARLDIGPRAVFHLPMADHALSLAIEGRLRIAGDARPGSGIAITLATDL